MKKLTIGIFITMFSLMSAAAVCRAFGWTWLQGDLWFSHENPWVLEGAKFALLLFEVIFVSMTMKVPTKQWWLAPVFAVTIFISPEPLETILFAFMLAMFTLLNRESLQRGIAILALTTIYGFLLEYGRYGSLGGAKYDAEYIVSSAWDYKLLFVNIYLFYKIGGEFNVRFLIGMVAEKRQRLLGLVRRQRGDGQRHGQNIQDQGGVNRDGD